MCNKAVEEAEKEWENHISASGRGSLLLKSHSVVLHRTLLEVLRQVPEGIFMPEDLPLNI